MQCNVVIYSILAKDNPKEYPLPKEAKPTSTYTFNGTCIFDAITQNCTQSGDGQEQCTESTESEIAENCDCSDPKKYNFQDKGRVKI